ncbi:MAG TPA: tetratricopeptide repeat protein [Candidatus Eisenbacteria bacterium]|nr:tetratricopeptide repeat protein [Candidatus Eisenbacteria bacterium]
MEQASPELAGELRSLLDQVPIIENHSARVDDLIAPLLAPALEPGSVETLRRLGPYRLVEVLGVGGMGIVYRAEQEEPLRREVAIKLLRGGLDPARVLARFTAERRAMALLEHPAIARILDAGLDTDGMPYLVTELVRGLPISEYCRRQESSVSDVVRLTIEVCRAVQHAHQKGIIHRDLKPSNILVGEVDGSPRPKIIDFGIARILEEEAGPGLTIEGQAIGTLGYMSPEQAGGRSRAIDTRTDVYSLGAVLYELLTGSLPHALDGLELSQALAVLEREVPRPLRIQLGKGESRDADLETIVMKALAREPDARYAGSGALADDLERYLSHEAILARPPSTMYELRKLVRRHRGAFVLGTAAVLLVAVFAVAMGLLYADQRRERERAQVASARAAAMNDFLLGMLGAANPGALGSSVTVREVLDRAIPTVDRSFAGEPAIQAEVTTTLGTTYRELGQHAIADSLLRRGLELERRAFGPRSIQVARGLRELSANALLWRRRQEADSLCRLALAMSEELEGPRGLDVERSLLLLADIQIKRGRQAEAESLLGRYLQMAKSIHGETSAEVGRGLSLMAMARTISGNEFGSYYRSAAQILTRELGADHAETLEVLSNYVDALNKERKWAEAVSLGKDVLARMRKTHGDAHPKVGQTIYRLSLSIASLGEVREAEALMREGLQIWRVSLGEENPLMAAGYARMAEVSEMDGKLADAEAWVRSAVDLSLKINAPEHPRAVGEMQHLARILAWRGKHAAADTFFRRVIEVRRRAYGTTAAVSLLSFGEYGMFLVDRGRLDSARTFLDATLTGLDGATPQFQVFQSGLALCLSASGERARADSLIAVAARGILTAPLHEIERRVALRRIVAYYDANRQSRLADPYRETARGIASRTVSQR